ncbi:uncharacterized protein LOC144923518 [Branchiostoma floridae x Branchiostoma belcheri]
MWEDKIPEWYYSTQLIVKQRPLDIADQEKVATWLRKPPRALKHDLKTLQDGEWLSDYVIEEYLRLIQKSCSTENIKVEIFDCTAYNRLGKKSAFSSYIKRQKTPKDVAGSDIVYIPVHESSHWGLLVFFPKKKSVFLLDSLSSCSFIDRTTALEKARSFLTHYLPSSETTWEQWSFSMPDIPQQTNSDDCGVFVCQYAYLLAHGYTLQLSQMMMPTLRKRMVLELCDGSIRENRVKVCTAAEVPLRRARCRARLLPSKKRHRSPPPLPEDRHLSVRRNILSALGKLKDGGCLKPEEEDESDTGNEADISSNCISLDDVLPDKGPSMSTPKGKLRRKKGSGIKKKKEGKLAKSACSPEEIREAWTTKCDCTKDCCGRLGFEKIKKARHSFWRPYSRERQSEFIRDAFEKADRRKEVEVAHYQWSYGGFAVCCKAWCAIYGIKRARFYEIKQVYESGRSTAPDGRKGMEYKSKAYLMAREWLHNHQQKFGDKMPNTQNTHLPQCATKKTIFEAYTDENWNEEKLLKESRFKVMWKKEFPNLRIPRKNRFTKCTECDTLKKLLKSAKSKADIEEVKERRTAHFNLQNAARQKYYSHIKKARREPQNYLSIIIDSMDQNKVAIPHFATQTKLQATLTPLKLHLTGALVHGQGRAFVYAWTDKFHMDTNITVNVLIDILLDLAKGYDGGHLPNTLYLQLDNSAKECKNKYIIAFACWLVHLRIFRKVKLGYLMPGHTHEDVDQLFSRFSTHLQREDAPTVPELFRRLSNAYTPHPECRLMTSMWDYRNIIDKEIGAISGHSRPHHFTAKLLGGKVQLKAQLWPDPLNPKVEIPLDRFIPRFPKCTSVKEWTINVDDKKVKEHNMALKTIEDDLQKWAETPMEKKSFFNFWSGFLKDERSEPGRPPWRLSNLKKHMAPVVEKSVVDNETRASLEKMSKKHTTPLNIVVKGKTNKAKNLKRKSTEDGKTKGSKKVRR